MLDITHINYLNLLQFSIYKSLKEYGIVRTQKNGD